MDDEEKSEESKNKKNKQAKKATKKVIQSMTPALIIILILLIIASAVYAIITKVVDTIKDVGQKIVNFLFGWIKGKDYIEISDDDVKKIIESVESLGIDYADLGLLGNIDYSADDVQEKLEEAKIKYTKMFIEAQIVTQELHRRKWRITRTSICLSY